MDNALCTECGKGKYYASDEEGSSVCINCIAGKYSRELGAFLEDTCTNCPAGSFSLLAGSIDCTLCPPGASSNAGATMCTYDAFATSRTPASKSQPIFTSPLSAPKQNKNTNMSLWLWVLILIVLCLLCYQIWNWRNQQQRKVEYELVESTSTTDNQL